MYKNELTKSEGRDILWRLVETLAYFEFVVKLRLYLQWAAEETGTMIYQEIAPIRRGVIVWRSGRRELYRLETANYTSGLIDHILASRSGKFIVAMKLSDIFLLSW